MANEEFRIVEYTEYTDSPAGETYRARFHNFSIDSFEVRSGDVIHTPVAVIEKDSGDVVIIAANRIKFIS